MDPDVIIRDEVDADAGAISEVTAAAFMTLEISSHTEQFIIETLRSAGALTLSLVAELNGAVTGHVAFSPVTLSDGTPGWYGLGPVSVLPAYQRQGVGARLIREGLARLKAMNARGCCLVGHPGYYGKFGFRNPSGLRVEGVPPEAFFALSFDGHYPQGTVEFHEGFRADGKNSSRRQADRGRPAAVVATEVAPRTRPSLYPEPFASRVSGREKRPLGDVFGLSNFGVNLTRMAPGSISALRHSHSRQDEFIYILEGAPILVTQSGETRLGPGMCAGFKAGEGGAWRFRHKNGEPY